MLKNKIVIAIIISKNNLGDSEQIYGTLDELLIILSKNNLLYDIKKVYIDQFDVKTIGFANIYISSSKRGIDVLFQIKKRYTDSVTVFISHQHWDNLGLIINSDNNPYGANLIILPKHGINKQLTTKIQNSETQLLTLDNVCFTSAHSSSTFNNSEIINAKYLGVVIGGDAELPNGDWLYFTKNDANDLAKFVINEFNTNHYSKLIITNSLRTGMFNHATHELINPHTQDTVDSISKAFVSKISKSLNTEQYSFYNYYRNCTSMLKPMLETIRSTQPSSKILVPGESPTIITQAISAIGNNVIVYHNSAMNKSHEKFVKIMFKKGLVSILGNDKVIVSNYNRKGGYNLNHPNKISANKIFNILCPE
jgi:hypothetical protein